MNFKIGDRVKVSTIEDVGKVILIEKDESGYFWLSIEWPEAKHGTGYYPAYQVRLAEEEPKVRWSEYSTGKKWEPTRLSRKEIRKELKKLSKEPGEISTQIVAIRNLMQYSPRKDLRNQLRQLSAEAFCVDKVLAEQIDKIADGV
jgi:hypothetical protein